MQKYFSLTATIILFGALILLPTVSAEAAELRGGERANVSTDETIDDDLYIAGGSVDSSGVINGDLLAAGGSVVVSESVSDDLHAAGGNVTVLADVAGDARIIGGSVTVAGSIGEDLAVAGGQTQLSGEGVGGDLVWAGEIITIGAPVAGNAELVGKEVYINAPIEGDVEFKGKKLVLEDGAVITGDLSYSSPNEAEIREGASVAGEVTYEEVDQNVSEEGSALGFATAGTFVWFLMLLAGALVLGLGLRRYTEELVSGTAASPLADLGRGFIGLVVMPIAAILLMITVIGLPLGIITLLTYIALLVYAGLLAPVLLGSFALKQIKQTGSHKVSWLTILLGVVLFILIGFIPVVGWITQFIFVLFTIGGVLRIKWQILKDYMGK